MPRRRLHTTTSLTLGSAFRRAVIVPAITATTLLVVACSDPPTSPDRAAAVAGVRQSMTSAERPFTFTTIDVPGATSTQASGIGPSGDVVGRYTDPVGAVHGFLLQRGELTTIDYPGAVYTDGLGIGPNGEIVGSYRMPGEPVVNLHGYLRTRDGRFLNVDYPGHTSTVAQRLLPDGTILGCRHDDDQMATMRGVAIGRHGVRETDLFASMHNGATPDGRRIVGLYTNVLASRMEGYLIQDGDVTPLVVPGSLMTTAWDVNPRGDIVGFFRDAAGFHGFLLTEDGYLTLDVPGATTTRAFGINARGDVVGNFVAGGRSHGFVATRPAR